MIVFTMVFLNNFKRDLNIFKWGSWEDRCFVQCGIEVVQNEDYSIDLKQSNFINDIEEIYLSRDRSRHTGQPVTETEKT